MTRTTILHQVRRMHDDVIARVDVVERHAARLSGPGAALHAARECAALRQALAALEARFLRTVALEHDDVFPVVLDALPEAAGVLDAQRGEHADIASMIAALRATLAEEPSAWRDERVRVAARDLVDLLRIHMRKEEAAIHRVLERVLTAEELALARRPSPRPARGAGVRTGGARRPSARSRRAPTVRQS